MTHPVRLARILFAAVLLVPCSAAAQSLESTSRPQFQPPPFSPHPGELVVHLTADNAVTSLPAVPLLMSQNGQVSMQLTDSAGDSPAYLIDMADHTVVLVDEAQTPSGGTTVGQVFQFTPSLTVPGVDGMTLAYHTPVARPYFIRPPELTTDSTKSARWFIGDPAGQAGLIFPAQVAFMSAQNVVRAYRRFQGEASTLPDGPALLLRLAEDVDLGSQGLLLMMDTTGSKLGSTPQAAVSSYGITTPSTAMAQVVPYDPDFPIYTDDLVYVHLTGFLPAGDCLVQLTNNIQSTVATGPSVELMGFDFWRLGQGLPVLGFQNNQDSRVGQDACTPPDPASSGACLSTRCEPTQPERPSGGSCSGAGVLPLGDPMTQEIPLKVGSQVCPAVGTEISERKCFAASGGVVVEISAEIPGGSLKVSKNGSVSGSSCKTLTVEGGYCAQMWICRTATSQLWEVCACGPGDSLNCFIKGSGCVSGGALVSTSCQQ